MKILKLTLLVLVLSFVFTASAMAQMENTVAILPIQANRLIAKSTTAEIYGKLAAPLAIREGFTIINEDQTSKKMGKIRGSILSKSNLSVLGPRFDATLLVAIKMRLYSSSTVNRMNYKYEVAFWDVNGQTMINTATGTCRKCSDQMLGEALEKDLEKLYAGPFILGLDTDPNGATIMGGSEKWGETPIRKVLPGGNYTIIIEKPGHKKMEVEFPMPDDRPIYATLPLAKDPDYVAPVVAAPVAAPEKPAPAPADGALVVPTDLPSITKREKENLSPPPVVKTDDDIQQEKAAPVKQIEEKVKEQTQEETEPISYAEVKKKDGMSLKRKWAWRTLGLSVALAAGGIGLTVAALHSDSKAGDTSLNPMLRYDYADRRDQYWIGSYVMYGLTAAAVTTSLVLFFTDDPYKNNSVAVAPTISPDSVGISTLVRY